MMKSTIENTSTNEDSLLDFRLIVNTIPGLVCTLTADWDLEVVNQRLLDYYGMTFEEIRDWKHNGVVHPDDLEGVIEKTIQSSKTGAPLDMEHRCRRHDGAFRWFQVRGMPLRDQHQTIARWYLLFTDIEDRKRNEALQAKENSLSLFINTIPVVAWSARPDGSIDFVSDHYLTFSGLSAAGADGWGWTQSIHPDDLPALLDYWQSIINAGTAGEIEARMRRFDGLYRSFLFRVTPLRDEAGSILKWFGTSTDINDRKEAEENVRRSEAFLAEVQQLTRIGSFSWCVSTEEIRWSKELYSIYDVDPSLRITFDLFAERLHRDDLKYLPDMLQRAQREMDDLEYPHRILMSDGAIKYLHLRAHARRDPEGRLEYIGAVQDVTERKLEEEALAKARQDLANATRITSLGVLTASIAHEINQPLSGIVTNASTSLRMLSGDQPNIEGARETARRTIRDGNRASDVVCRLRTLFSKGEIAAVPLDLSEVAREVIALSQSELQRNRISLQEELAEGLPQISGDRVQLQQVILNLLRNASDAFDSFHGVQRNIRIKTDIDDDNRVRLSVADSGIGFDPELSETLFEAFHTTKTKGMGIGLSVSRSIIEAHRGKIWARPNDGPGSTFAFSIPREFDMSLGNYHAFSGDAIDASGKPRSPNPSHDSLPPDIELAERLDANVSFRKAIPKDNGT
jgi:PAS domain S-box-containing protein